VVVWIRVAAVALQRRGRCSGGIADREPARGRDRRADRILREHAGDEGESEWWEEFPRAGGRGEADDAGRVPASGRAVRAIGGRTVAAAESESNAAVPSDIRPSECAVGGATSQGAGSRGHRGG